MQGLRRWRQREMICKRFFSCVLTGFLGSAWRRRQPATRLILKYFAVDCNLDGAVSVRVHFITISKAFRRETGDGTPPAVVDYDISGLRQR